MIIKRKLYTRQETKAAKEIYEALKKGNIGRDLPAKDFVKLRHLSNDIIDTFSGDKNKINHDEAKNILEKLGLPETSKAFKRMMEKYTNPELHKRFIDVQKAEKFNKESILKERDKLNKLLNNAKKEQESIDNLKKDFLYLSGKKGSKLSSPELAQKAIKYVNKKHSIKITHDSNKPTSYSHERFSKNPGTINFQYKADSRDPSTVLHEDGHFLSTSKYRETRSDNWKRNITGLNPSVSTSENLQESIKNRMRDLARLTEEANASYHAAARENMLGFGDDLQKKASKKSLSNAYRTYELGRASNITFDKFNREAGKIVSKIKKNKKSGI